MKVLDPSCGSGIFLVKAFKKLLTFNKENIYDLIRNNIFGIDSNEDAVDITILSLYVALLDYVDDFSNFKFPQLKNKNIICHDFFDEKFNDLGSFDCIFGNPPWFQAKGGFHSFEIYAKKHFIPLSNRQIAEAFIVRAGDFLNDNGVCSFILTSKILFNLRDIKFRKFLLNNYNVSEIFDLTLIRRYLFKGSEWPAFILTYNNKSPDDLIKHIKIEGNLYAKYLNKIHLSFGDEQYVKRIDLLKYDWLFKTLISGNWDDFKLIKKLKKDNSTLGDFILKHPYIKSGVGFKKSKDDIGIDVSEFYNLDYVKNSDLTQYFFTSSEKWEFKYIKSGDKTLLNPPFVLMRSSFRKNFDFVAAYCDREVVFDYNTYVIKGRFEDEVVLKNIMALINSDLFKYFFYMTGNVGVEKNRSSFSERKKFPLNSNIINNMELYEMVCLIESNRDLINFYKEKINDLIYDVYGLSDFEINLVKNMVNKTKK